MHQERVQQLKTMELFMLQLKKGIGMYLENGATGYNRAGGLIEIDPSAQNAIAVYSTGGTTVFKNYGTIRLKSSRFKRYCNC